ncbi:short chain dehydrogenase/reductase [Chloropicon roscoffensis]|uniref:Short chain dehydrogenase/reductase n=1 Tax=Chloropicon roscoffensis TaxID=1461544 RepID=A0AAX4PKU5_9CHLO
MKTVLVTGATQGIGLHTALRLVKNHHVVLHGRTAESGEAALARIRSESGARKEDFSLVTGDLSDLAQVRGVADQVKEKVEGVDVLINNAGVFADEQRQTSADGYELTFAVNVLAPFALTKLLLPAMNRNGHVINTSSLSAQGKVPWEDLQLERAYSNHKAYSLSKLLIQMVTYALHRRFLDGAEYGGRGLKTNTLDPGTVDTRMLRKGWAMSGIPLETADDTFKLATNPDPPKGKYFVGNKLTAPVGGARPREDQERLWAILKSMCSDL